jgi:predicted amidophosphoribosyltransferase
MELLKELIIFLKFRRKLWLAPIIAVMLLLGALLIVAQSSVIAPFIYTIF